MRVPYRTRRVASGLSAEVLRPIVTFWDSVYGAPSSAAAVSTQELDDQSAVLAQFFWVE